jgi:uncharacterized protein YktA (UPF0223 family)
MENMEILSVIAGFIGTIAVVIGLINKISRDLEQKRSRIYERFDEFKSMVDNKYVSKEVFNLFQQTMTHDLNEIKTDIKILLKLKMSMYKKEDEGGVCDG